MPNDQLQKINRNVAPVTSMEQTVIETLISKAVDSKSAVEVIKELRAMRLDDQMRESVSAFNAAFSRFQEQCPIIIKNKSVPDRSGNVAYKYANIENIEAAIRPVERENGFSHTFNQDVESQPGWVIARCIVLHERGHSRETVSKFPIGTKTAIQSDTQQYAAALTFANRRTLANAYGLVIAGEDKDGQGKPHVVAPNAMEPERQDDSIKRLAAELWKILTPVRGTARNWVGANQWLWKNEILDGAIPEEAPNLDEKRFEDVILKSKEVLSHV